MTENTEHSKHTCMCHSTQRELNDAAPFILKPIDKVENGVLIAMPSEEGMLCGHFGHCTEFTIFEVNLEERRIIAKSTIQPPPHQPGLLPAWLQAMQINIVIAGGMGERAQDLLAMRGIDVLAGASAGKGEEVVQAYLNNTLEFSQHSCSHGCHN